ncbi:hypothetical protein FAF44_32955 [Nonomuraea sp. MG754425]|nr:hypothetical protein [Nonomuraea sp. MG754425]
MRLDQPTAVEQRAVGAGQQVPADVFTGHRVQRLADLDVEAPRDQITTREHSDFVHLRLRAEVVGRLVRGHATV